MKYLLLFITFNACTWIFSQIGIGSFSVDPSAALDVNSSNKGVLLPSISLLSNDDVSTIAAPVSGLLIYNSATAGSGANKVIPGYYFYNGLNWELLNYNNTDKINLQTGNYTLTNSDVNTVVIINSSTSSNVTIPSSLVKGFKCSVIMIGSGEVNIIGSGVTVNSANGSKIRLQNRSIGFVKDDAASAFLFGPISF